MTPDAGQYDSAVAPASELGALAREAAGCTRCALSDTRTQVVFGVGDSSADLLFVGEAPGRDEDLQGEPFVGRSGKLLDRLVAEEMGIDRSQFYIANVVKCRPPDNRDPKPDEIAACRPWLEAELAVLRPAAVVALGATAAQTLMGPSFRVLRDRGHPFRTPAGLPLIATVHPSSILRAPPERHASEFAAFVSDLKVAVRLLAAPT